MNIKKYNNYEIFSVWNFKNTALQNKILDNQTSLMDITNKSYIENMIKIAQNNPSNNFIIYISSKSKIDEIQSIINNENKKVKNNKINNLKFKFFQTKERQNWTFSGHIDSMKLEVIDKLLTNRKDAAFFDLDLLEDQKIVYNSLENAEKSKSKRYFINDIYDEKSQYWHSNTYQFSPKILIFESNDKNQSFIQESLNLAQELTIPREYKKGEKYFNIHFCTHLLTLKENNIISENQFNQIKSEYLQNKNNENKLDEIEKNISELYLNNLNKFDFVQNESKEFSEQFRGGSWADTAAQPASKIKNDSISIDNSVENSM
jgi:hypothetical protein